MKPGKEPHAAREPRFGHPCSRVISDARKQINGAFIWQTYHVVNMFCDKIALPNFAKVNIEISKNMKGKFFKLSS